MRNQTAENSGAGKLADGGKAVETLSFILPAVLNIENADALSAELKQLPLNEKTLLVLDAAKVESITTPGLQLIVSLEKSLSVQGGSLVINNQPDVLINSFKDSGLEVLLKKAG